MPFRIDRILTGTTVSICHLLFPLFQMGVVPQEPVLFDRSIKENIKYGKSHATDEEVENSAKDANAHEFITELKEGYETNVGESGSQISGDMLFISWIPVASQKLGIPQLNLAALIIV